MARMEAIPALEVSLPMVGWVGSVAIMAPMVVMVEAGMWLRLPMEEEYQHLGITPLLLSTWPSWVELEVVEEDQLLLSQEGMVAA